MNRIKDYGALSEKIQKWIINYVEENKIEKLVVGVSGGIDSAVVSTLCALTGIPTVGVGIEINSNPKNTNLSKKQLDFLKEKKVDTYEYNLSQVYDTFVSSINKKFDSNLGFANTKSRLRMCLLYQIAASVNGLVVGTGNKVEDFGIGFFTKYGDGGVDLSPIADLYKSEVRELGRYLGIIDEIISATPTDGLWEDDRTDETQIGATYEELEWVMEEGLPNIQSYKTKQEINLIEKFINLNKKNSHKMNPIPVFKLLENNII